MSKELNTELLATMIRKKRGDLGLRAAADEIGDISAPTLSRVEAGNVPDVDTFLKLCRWLGMDPSTFASDPGARSHAAAAKVSKRDIVITNLRADKTLDKKVVNALVEMIEVAYKFTPGK
ncbi:MAG: helix-turn-helix transcriptional regulator [Flavobacteriales bacterium]|nr:helix-turn-helix transcriptional regulator [Flavobacteriales bacterium]